MARVYRNISRPLLFFNMELLDLGIVFAGMILSFLISNSTVVTILFTGALYVVIRYFKRGRAPGFFLHLIKFLITPAESGVGLKDRLPPYLRK